MDKIQSIYNKSLSLNDFKFKLLEKAETDKTIYKALKNVDVTEYEPAVARTLSFLKGAAKPPLSKEECSLIKKIEERHGA